MSSLDSAGLGPDDIKGDAFKTAFLQNIHDCLSGGRSATLLGTPLPVDYPDFSFVETDKLANDFYNPDSDTASSHAEDKPSYHDIIFEVLSKVSTGLNLPETKPIIILGVQIQDPTIPIAVILEQLRSLNLSISIDLDFILSIPMEFLEAVSAYVDPTAPDVEPLCDLLIQMNNNVVPGGDKAEFCQTLESVLPLDFSGIQVPMPEFPTPPFINIDFPFDLITLPEPPFGIIGFFAALVEAIKLALADLIEYISQAAVELVDAIASGIRGLVEYLISKIFLFLSIDLLVERFPNLFEQPGFVATFTTIIKYLIGMLIIAIVGYFLGVGLIVEGIKELLSL